MFAPRKWSSDGSSGPDVRGIGEADKVALLAMRAVSAPLVPGADGARGQCRLHAAAQAADMSENRCQSRDGALLRCYHSELLVASSGSESTLSPKSQS